MTYEIRLSRDAEKYQDRLRPEDRQRMVRRLEQIAADPRGPYSKPLVNAAGFRSTRVGDWRILFVINDDKRAIEVTNIGPRGGIYRRL